MFNVPEWLESTCRQKKLCLVQQYDVASRLPDIGEWNPGKPLAGLACPHYQETPYKPRLPVVHELQRNEIT